LDRRSSGFPNGSRGSVPNALAGENRKEDDLFDRPPWKWKRPVEIHYGGLGAAEAYCAAANNTTRLIINIAVRIFFMVPAPIKMSYSLRGNI
jgi:hypothetical protein